MGYKYDKTEILSIGMELIRKKGYHNVGISELLKAAEIPKGSFYNFFESKEDFAIQAIELYGQQSQQQVRQYLSEVQSLPPLQRLKAVYKFLIEWNVTDGCDAGCLINNACMELGGLNRSITAAAERMFQASLTLFIPTIEAGQADGSITKEFSAPYLAEYLQAGLNGGFSRMKAQGDRTYLDQWLQMSFAFIQATPQTVLS